MSRPLLLHVTNGESAGNTLRQTTLGGAVLSWQDVLHEGPVPAVPRRELLRLRAAFLSECGWGSRAAIRSALERRDKQFVSALQDGLHVVLWFEHDLFDELQLVDALALADETGASPELIVVDSFPGKPGFRGLGELTADELETLWPDRRAATSAVLAEARAAWDAVRTPEPTALAEWAVGDAELFVDGALRLLEELPAPADGLSTTERHALEAITRGTTSPHAAFVAAQDLEPAPFLGDARFYHVLANLAAGDNRLDAGQLGPLLLRGDRAPRVELLGIDRWVGGTHLTPENTWRWDSTGRRLVEP